MKIDQKTGIILLLLAVIGLMWFFRCDFLCTDCCEEELNDTDDDTYTPPTYTCGYDDNQVCGGTCPSGEECIEYDVVAGFECGCVEIVDCQATCSNAGYPYYEGTDVTGSELTQCGDYANTQCSNGSISTVIGDCCCWDCGDNL